MSRIIITTNSLNRSGYRILTEGIDMTAYMKNPVMFYDHNTYRLPIGKWEDLKVENGVMTGIPVFDEKDEEAMKIKQKFEDGYLNAASLHVKPLAYSEAPEHLVEGQRYETITKSEMLEISIVGIPGNSEAVRLSADAKQPLLLKKVSTEMEHLKKIALGLGLAETASETEVLAAIENIKQNQVNTLIAQGVEKGLITDANKPSWVALAANNYDAAKLVIDAHIPNPLSNSPQEGEDSKGKSLMQTMRLAADKNTVVVSGDRSAWTFQKWEQEDVAGLIELRKSNPSAYEKLAQAYYQNVTGAKYEN